VRKLMGTPPSDGVATRAARGAAEGIAATAAMTAVFGAGKAAGAFRTPPPERVVDEAADNLNTETPPPPAKGPIVWMAHFAFGAAMGVIFRTVRPRSRMPVVEGVLFGLCVWAVSYLVALPAARLFPPAHRDRFSRQAVNVAAHTVFGATLGVAGRRAR
jgi:hypothetical protein